MTIGHVPQGGMMQDFNDLSDESAAIVDVGGVQSSGNELAVGSWLDASRPPEFTRYPSNLNTLDQIPTYFRRMQRILQRRGHTCEEAEDLVQDAFLKVQEYCDKGHHVQKPENFLVRTVLRLAINARRDEHRDLYSAERIEDLTLIVDTNPTPDELLARDECLTRMRDALDAANRRTRDVFFMHRLDGLSYSQIARHFGVSISAVEKHVARALAILAEVNERE
jgi:RNA polymerase sigma factor (sigma-70 family)